MQFQSINFFYTMQWVASSPEGDVVLTPELIEKLEEIRLANWPNPEPTKFKNISFDIYWNRGEYSGIHNYRMNGEHAQNRYEGILIFD